jgi:hypothetical protein
LEIDATKIPAEGQKIFVVAKSQSKQKRGRNVFDTTLEFAQKRVFVCRRTAIIYVHRKRVADRLFRACNLFTFATALAKKLIRFIHCDVSFHRTRHSLKPTFDPDGPKLIS